MYLLKLNIMNKEVYLLQYQFNPMFSRTSFILTNKKYPFISSKKKCFFFVDSPVKV